MDVLIQIIPSESELKPLMELCMIWVIIEATVSTLTKTIPTGDKVATHMMTQTNSGSLWETKKITDLSIGDSVTHSSTIFPPRTVMDGTFKSLPIQKLKLTMVKTITIGHSKLSKVNQVGITSDPENIMSGYQITVTAAAGTSKVYQRKMQLHSISRNGWKEVWAKMVKHVHQQCHLSDEIQSEKQVY